MVMIRMPSSLKGYSLKLRKKRILNTTLKLPGLRASAHGGGIKGKQGVGVKVKTKYLSLR